MKRHALVIVLVTAILAGAYIVGRPNHVAAPAPATQARETHTAPRPPAPQFDKAQYSLSDPASLWVVVNKQRPLSPPNYAPADLTAISNGQQMRAAAAQAFTTLVSAAKTAGYSLVAESGYRSYTTQVSVYNSEVKAFGQAKADSESARPGYSEHQTGWAVDIGMPGCYEDCFGTKPAASWLLTNAYKFGFILRYPADKADITGYRNEPWHFRYVGVSLSTEMQKEKVTTLEEFFGLPAAPSYPS